MLKFEITQQTALSVNQWATYHNPKNFKRPDEFIPERWIGNDFSTENKASFQPFSFGPRNCLGRKYVYLLALNEVFQIANDRIVWRTMKCV